VTEGPINVFLSYSRKDNDLLDNFNVHLAGLVNTGQITTWHDRDIEAGSEWEPVLQHQLNTAKIIILLISANFIASEYCYGKELKRAIERHDAGEAHVIPVILKPCVWNLSKIPFSKLNVLPDQARPVTKWDDPEEAFTLVVEHIARIVDRLGKDCQQQKKLEEQRKLELLQPELPRTSSPLPIESQQSSVQPLSNPAPVPPTQHPVDAIVLKSEQGVDYGTLRDLLKAGKWRAADEETLRVMLKAANCESSGWLDLGDLEKFPCKDLKTLDLLWVTASNDHFGFSVQKKIWEECGSPMSDNDDWSKFLDLVGWRRKGESNYNYYNKIKFALNFSPAGELPRKIGEGGVALFSRKEL
jgi:hypothetical protein